MLDDVGNGRCHPSLAVARFIAVNHSRERAGGREGGGDRVDQP
jgi:hypothetical protein